MILQNVGVHQARRGEDYRFHRDDFWELMYVRSGQVVCQQEAERYALHHGMAILHPPQALHADFAVSAYQTYYLWLDLPTKGMWTRQDLPRICYDDEMNRLERLCSEILWEWNHHHKNQGEPDRNSDSMLRLLTEQLRITIERCSAMSEQSVGEQVVLAAEQIMEREYPQTLTVAEIARRIPTSESSLYSYFSALRGQTPMGVLQAIRLRHALVHLHHSTRTLDTIAALCGYCSASHLSRHVSLATGASPGKLRAGKTDRR